MINIYSVITEGVVVPASTALADKFNLLKGCCRILLQVDLEYGFFFVVYIISLPSNFLDIMNIREVIYMEKKERHVEILHFVVLVVNVAHICLCLIVQHFWWKLVTLLVDLFQVHDELVLEVDPSVIKEAALLLRMSMENAALLHGICLASFDKWFLSLSLSLE